MTMRRIRRATALAAVVAVLALGALPASAADVRSPLYGGYRSAAPANKTVTATYVLTAVTCGSTTSGAAHVVSHVRNGTYVHSAGVIEWCSGGALRYYAETRVNNAGTVVQKPASAGNKITVSLTVTGTTVKSTIKNVTRGWTVTASGPLGAVNQIQVGTVTTQSGGTAVPLAKFAPQTFTAVAIGGKPLGQTAPTRLIMTGAGGVVRVQPSAIAGGAKFTNTWKHA
jgi:hypothetical protein